MLRLLPLAILLALPATAKAQLASFCNGRVTAENFTSNRTGTRAEYRASMMNRSGAQVTILFTYRGALIDRPTNRTFQIGPRQSLQVNLGYQTIVGAGQNLLPTQLAENVTVSCLS